MTPKLNRHLSLYAACSLLLATTACAPDIMRPADEGSPGSGMVLLAKQMQAKGDKAGAADFYMRALQRDPHDIVALSELGALFEVANNLNEALRYYQLAHAEKPKDAELLRRLGRVSIAMQNYAEARDYYEKALDEEDDDPKALNGMGVALDNLGNHEKALKYFRDALDEDPQNMATLNNLAYSRIAAGEYAEAIKLLEPLHRTANATPALRQNLALAYGLSGMESDAERVARMDLTPAQIKSNLAFYRKKRMELGKSAQPYLEFGTYPTEAMALANAEEVQQEKVLAGLVVNVVPELSSGNGVPKFILRADVSGKKPDEIKEICADLVEKKMMCVVKKTH